MTNDFQSGIPLTATRPQDCYAVYPKTVPTEYLCQCFKGASSATSVTINCGHLDRFNGW